jgi:hypothetical protein
MQLFGHTDMVLKSDLHLQQTCLRARLVEHLSRAWVAQQSVT